MNIRTVANIMFFLAAVFICSQVSAINQAQSVKPLALACEQQLSND